MESTILKINRTNKELPLPQYQSEGASGIDLCANLKESITLSSGERHLIPTGIKAEVPKGYEMQIRPRSGLALKHGVTVLNSPGTIDSDYRGEIGIILINHGSKPFVINNGDKIAQAVVQRVPQVTIEETDILSTTVRNTDGFGSTGVKITNTTNTKTDDYKPNIFVSSKRIAEDTNAHIIRGENQTNTFEEDYN